MSSLACKCVFYKPEHVMQRGNTMEIDFKCLEMQQWNMPTHGAQRVDEKWGYFSSYHVYSQSCVH